MRLLKKDNADQKRGGLGSVRWRPKLLLVLVLYLLMASLSACQVLPLYSGELVGNATVYGIKVRYLFPKDDLSAISNRDGYPYVGVATYDPLERGCNILLRRSFVERAELASLRKVIAHEVGHCLDRYLLKYSHNGFSDEGCRWGDYWCRPEEGFANFYAHYFIDSCTSLTLLGWPFDMAETTCKEMPHPKSLTPDLMAIVFADFNK